MKAVFNWSGGKDSSLCLYYVQKQQEYNVRMLVTSVNQDYNRVSMHGVRRELLERQAESIGLPLFPLMFPEKMSMEMYNKVLVNACQSFVDQGIHHSIFGDIFLEDLRQYRENQLSQANMKAVFPIWKKSTEDLAKKFIQLGFKAIIVCINNSYLSKEFVGREFDQNFLNDLPQNVDPCGENGEFHTFVYDGPIFKTSIDTERGEIVYREYKSENDTTNTQDDNYYQSATQSPTSGFWFADLLPAKVTS